MRKPGCPQYRLKPAVQSETSKMPLYCGSLEASTNAWLTSSLVTFFQAAK